VLQFTKIKLTGSSFNNVTSQKEIQHQNTFNHKEMKCQGNWKCWISIVF